ncbi:MAG: ABC transporter permease subunit [Nitrospira sp. CR1.1]|jgi:phosphate transport system permease protein|nr:ABC transporter permease subunit [Nitrospira sp. CR1.1]
MKTNPLRYFFAPVRVRSLIDRVARAVITVGGLATIVSILGMFFFLFREVTPLFTAPSAKLSQRLNVPALLADEGPAQVAVDEHREIAQIFTSGAIQFFDLASGRPILVETPAQLTSRQVTAMASGGGHTSRLAVGTADGELIVLKIGTMTEFSEQGERRKRPQIHAGPPIPVAKSPIVRLAYRSNDQGSLLALATKAGRLFLARIAPDDPGGADMVITELPQPPSAVTSLALDASHEHLFVGTADGHVVHVGLSEAQPPEVRGSYVVAAPTTAVTMLGFLSGDRSLVVMAADGVVSTWGLVRRADAPSGWKLTQMHTFRSHPSPVTAFAPSQRVKGFITGDAKGNVFLHHATSSQTLLRLTVGEFPIRAVSFAPKGDGVIALDEAGQLSLYQVQNPYPEVTWETLFGKVWYEGYDQPAYVWQSSSGSDDVEPKLGLLPLAFGTLKGTIYALFLAVPIAILAAICTSQFMHHDLRAKVKPIIEVMAALPTVVLGFLAGLWLAPLLERMLPALAGMVLVLPMLVITASFFWHLCPLSVKRRLSPGNEALMLMPILALGIGGCLWAHSFFEVWWFDGNIKAWLTNRLGIQYDQRNALVVGIVMGFAIVPVIYSIAEEALSNVPRSHIAGSLALGATRWQTVWHLVLLSASPGIFSAVMIGFGRAIGETMIVLMATGNTPILDWNWANGFRTLSANIAVEIPEAPHGGSLYRVLFLAALLLFIVTFVINSLAELVRQRLRDKYSHG